MDDSEINDIFKIIDKNPNDKKISVDEFKDSFGELYGLSGEYIRPIFQKIDDNGNYIIELSEQNELFNSLIADVHPEEWEPLTKLEDFLFPNIYAMSMPCPGSSLEDERGNIYDEDGEWTIKPGEELLKGYEVRDRVGCDYGSISFKNPRLIDPDDKRTSKELVDAIILSNLRLFNFLIIKHGITNVISLENNYTMLSNIEESTFYKVRDSKLNTEIGSRKDIPHSMYKWSVVNVPDFTTPIVDNYLEVFEIMRNKNPDHKLVIHCAAGWGRTGSVVYLFYYLNELIKNDKLIYFYNKTFEEFGELFLNMLTKEWESEDKILYSKKSVGELWGNIESDVISPNQEVLWNMYIFLLRIIENFYHPELKEQKFYSNKLKANVSKSYFFENLE